MSRLVWLRYALIPVALVLAQVTPDRHALIFGVSAAAIVLLASEIGAATSAVASSLGSGLGGLLNATFGNAAELVIGTLALRHGLTDLVKASITGSILSNVLLVFGAAAVAGGLRDQIVRFNRTAASLGTTMLVLSAIALVVPAVFHELARRGGVNTELRLDTEIAVVLFVAYLLFLWFSLGTHRVLFRGAAEPEDTAPHGTSMPTWVWVVRLGVATAAAAVVADALLGTLEAIGAALGTTERFVGVIIVAIIGNAAEHYSAVVLAWRRRMDAALQIAVGSSTQIALFVAPVMVFLSFVLGPHPIDLLFTPFEIAAVVASVVIIAFIAHDGETHWMEGVLLIAVYAILALGFFFLPA